MSKTILVVDDDPQFLSELKPILEHAGFRTVIAVDGDQALATVETGCQIDAAIVDLALPTVGGFQVIGALCKPGIRQIPIVAVTGAYSDLYLEVAEYLGALISIRKPTPGQSMNLILDALQSVLKDESTV